MVLFEEVLEEIGDSTDLSVVLRVIYNYYLNKKEREVYEAFVLNIQGKPQRELGILLGLQRFKVSRAITKLKRKLRIKGDLFTTKKDDLDNLILYIKHNFDRKKYLIISYLLAGNKYYNIAKRFKCSSALIFKACYFIEHRLSKEQASLFISAVRALK